MVIVHKCEINVLGGENVIPTWMYIVLNDNLQNSMFVRM